MIQKSSLPENLRSVSIVLTPDNAREGVLGRMIGSCGVRADDGKILGVFERLALEREPDAAATVGLGGPCLGALRQRLLEAAEASAVIEIVTTRPF